jgi:hypothetical protein
MTLRYDTKVRLRDDYYTRRGFPAGKGFLPVGWIGKKIDSYVEDEGESAVYQMIYQFKGTVRESGGENLIYVQESDVQVVNEVEYLKWLAG